MTGGRAHLSGMGGKSTGEGFFRGGMLDKTKLEVGGAAAAAAAAGMLRGLSDKREK